MSPLSLNRSRILAVSWGAMRVAEATWLVVREALVERKYSSTLPSSPSRDIRRCHLPSLPFARHLDCCTSWRRERKKLNPPDLSVFSMMPILFNSGTADGSPRR